MTKFEEGLKLIETRCGNGKDNVISLATVALEPNPDGKPCLWSRDVDAYYEDGVFYVSTWGKSKKMQQIAKNPNVAFTVCMEWISGNGTGENLGWVLDPKNSDIRAKLRKAFEKWYDFANKEDNENCCILAIRITNAIVIKDHGAVRYNMDFVNKTA